MVQKNANNRLQIPGTGFIKTFKSPCPSTPNLASPYTTFCVKGASNHIKNEMGSDKLTTLKYSIESE